MDINNGGTAQISGLTTAEACATYLGKDNSQQSGKLSVDHATLNQCGDIVVGDSGTGSLSITNGGLVNTQFDALIAAHAGSNGSVTVDGSNPDGRKSTWTLQDGAGLSVGAVDGSATGTGLLTVTNQGAVTAGSVHVYGSGTLTGNGTVSATNGTTIDGMLAPDWTLTISGDLTFSSTSSNPNMQCNVIPGNLGSIDVDISGGATLNGTVSVTMTGTFTPGTQFTLLHAGGGRINDSRFSHQSLKYPTNQCFIPKITYDTSNVYLYLQDICH